MFESSEARRRDATHAVRAFVDTVDETIPNVVDPSMRKKIVDSALALADKLGATQLEFLRSVSKIGIPPFSFRLKPNPAS